MNAGKQNLDLHCCPLNSYRGCLLNMGSALYRFDCVTEQGKSKHVANKYVYKVRPGKVSKVPYLLNYDLLIGETLHDCACSF